MNASKNKTHREKELDEDDVYYMHNELKQWDRDCRVKHGEPTWYYFSKGRHRKI